MYIIIVYDVEQKRVAKVCKYLRKYLHWIQNSVFEGEVSEGKFKELQTGLKRIINKEVDSILFFKLRASYDVEKEVMGVEKAPVESIL